MLEDFTYEGDIKSPKITLKCNGELEFSGRSLPENAKEIYAPVFNWMTIQRQSCGNYSYQFQIRIFQYNIFKDDL